MNGLGFWDTVGKVALTVASGPLAPVVGGYFLYDAYKESQAPGAPAEVPQAGPPPAAPPVQAPAYAPPPAPAYAPPPAAYSPPAPQQQAASSIIAGVPNSALLLGAGALALVWYASGKGGKRRR